MLRVSWLGRWQASEVGSTLQVMTTFTLLFLLTRVGPGLWQLLAPTSLATAAKDLGIWFCLSQSHNLTIGQPCWP